MTNSGILYSYVQNSGESGALIRASGSGLVLRIALRLMTLLSRKHGRGLLLHFNPKAGKSSNRMVGTPRFWAYLRDTDN
jgi:hypothetical protein